MSIVSTNILSLSSQRTLSYSSSSLATSLQRLSTGRRINRAKDDAAGLAISERMTTQIRGGASAIRNTADGVSLAQTAEGALSSISNILQRIRELAVQSSNATNSSSDRLALNNEVQQLKQELFRLVASAEFNGTKLLDGSTPALDFQVGPNYSQTIRVTTSNFKSTSVGVYKIGHSVASDLSGVGDLSPGSALGTKPGSVGSGGNFSGIVGGTIAFSDATSSHSITYPPDATAESVAHSINQVGSEIKANAETVAIVAGSPSAHFTLGNSFGFVRGGEYVVQLTSDTSKDGSGNPAKFSTISFKVGGVATTTLPPPIPNWEVSSPDQLSDAVSAFNSVSSETGFTAEVTQTSTGTYGIKLRNPEGKSLRMSLVSSKATAVDGTTGFNRLLVNNAADFYKPNYEGHPMARTLSSGWGGGTDGVWVTGSLTLSSNRQFSMTSTSTDFFTQTSVVSQLQEAADMDVSTFDASQRTLSIADGVIDAVNSQRSLYGAVQSRFESTSSNQQTAIEALSAARSRIIDADIAAETANLTKQEILQQAGVAVLAQANQTPTGVLGLLK